jgi:hypothetical protein
MVLRQSDSILVLGTVQPFEKDEGLVSAQRDDHTVGIGFVDRSRGLEWCPACRIDEP